MAKRLFDISVALLVLALAAIPLILIFLLVRILLGHPAIFSQERPGLRGKIFKMYKFRSMTNEKDSSGNLLPDEQRLTRLGRFLRATSLDELPELFNILKGDMSLVGPRPLLVSYLPLYTSRQAKRHDVRPGVTGWAQVNGRNLISWEERFELDVWYVENRSFFLDLKILVLTLLKVVTREGVNTKAGTTMPPFNGTP